MLDENIILGTGNYENVKSGNTVSITGDGGAAWGYSGNAYKKLAPKLVTYTPYAKGLEEIKKLKKLYVISDWEYKYYLEQLINQYIESYYDIRLKDLDVYKLLEDLKEKFGVGIIFLCHESIEEFCHRRLLADFIYIKTGIVIPEISINTEGKKKILKSISYVDKLKKIM